MTGFSKRYNSAEKFHELKPNLVLVLFLHLVYRSFMASSAAPSRRPPSPPPAVPAGTPSAPDEITGTEFTGIGGRPRAPARARRPADRGRPLRAARARGFRRRLAEPRGTAAVYDHGRDRHRPQGDHPQRLARHLLRPLDQSLSRLRARLHLLLRPPAPRLYGPLARPRFRVEALRQAGRA